MGRGCSDTSPESRTTIGNDKCYSRCRVFDSTYSAVFRQIAVSKTVKSHFQQVCYLCCTVSVEYFVGVGYCCRPDFRLFAENLVHFIHAAHTVANVAYRLVKKSCISRLATATVFSRISSGYASLCDGRAVERYSVTLCCLNLRCCKNRVFQRRRFFPRIWSGPLMGWTQQTRKLVCSGPTVRVQINASAVFCRIYEPDDLLVRTPVPCQ